MLNRCLATAFVGKSKDNCTSEVVTILLSLMLPAILGNMLSSMYVELVDSTYSSLASNTADSQMVQM